MVLNIRSAISSRFVVVPFRGNRCDQNGTHLRWIFTCTESTSQLNVNVRFRRVLQMDSYWTRIIKQKMRQIAYANANEGNDNKHMNLCRPICECASDSCVRLSNEYPTGAGPMRFVCFFTTIFKSVDGILGSHWTKRHIRALIVKTVISYPGIASSSESLPCKHKMAVSDASRWKHFQTVQSVLWFGLQVSPRGISRFMESLSKGTGG